MAESALTLSAAFAALSAAFGSPAASCARASSTQTRRFSECAPESADSALTASAGSMAEAWNAFSSTESPCSDTRRE